MPALRKRAGKRLRVRKSPAARVIALAVDMEEPLNEAIDAVQALRFIGYGLTQHGGEEEGRAVSSLAWTACQRLDVLQETWRRLWKAGMADRRFL
jgi:hypothetical protein